MIIDSHAHLKHGDTGKTEYSAARIVSAMDRAGIDKSVVFAMSTTTKHSIDMAATAVEEFPDRLTPYVYALPSYQKPVLAELEEAVVERGFRGIKIHAGECRLTQYTADPVFELAGARGVPCLVDFCGDFEAAARIAAAFPSTNVIVAHIGRYLCTDDGLTDRFIAIAEKHENVYLDVSGVARIWKIADAVKRLGSERVVWGTDGPHETPDICTFAEAELTKVSILGLSEKQRADVLGGTIARLLGI